MTPKKSRKRKVEKQDCIVIVFPPCWRKGTVLRVADKMVNGEPEGRDSYWRSVLAEIEGQLEALGSTDADIDRELRQFTAAVQAEVYRIQGRTPGPNGVA